MRSNPWKQSKKGRKKIGVGFKQNDDDEEDDDDCGGGRTGGCFWSIFWMVMWYYHAQTYFFVS